MTEDCVEAIKDITATGMTLRGTIWGKNKAAACARGAAAKNNGKMIPPGNLPAHAKAMATSFATPTDNAAWADWNGTEGFTYACWVKIVAKPCFVAAKAVC